MDECRHDTKGLYSLVANLTGTKSENPLPPNHSDDELANMFADYFMEKIEKSDQVWMIILNTNHQMITLHPYQA